MDLHAELIALLQKAKSTNEYFNPHLLIDVLNAIDDTHSSDESIVPDELRKWAFDMYSR